MLVNKIHTDQNFLNGLISIVYLTKIDKNFDILACNAISLLNLAKCNFNNKDFSDISIKNACLKGAILTNTNFEGANLEGVKFT